MSFLLVSEGTKIAQISFQSTEDRELSLGAAVPANAVGLQKDASEAFRERLFFQQPAKCSLKI